MGMSIDDMYDWLYRLKSELVVYMPKEWHEPMRDSIQDAITFSRKYQMLKADYETRLKADMVAMLEEISLKFDEQYYANRHELHDDSLNRGLEQGQSIIQQKINLLKAESEGEE